MSAPISAAALRRMASLAVFAPLAASIFAAALAPRPAEAADVSAPRVVSLPPAVQDQPPPDSQWCYGGLHGSVQHTRFDVDARQMPSYLNPPSFVNHHKSYVTAPIIGAQVGCNYVAKSFLIGVEGEGWLQPFRSPPHCETLIDPARECMRLRERFGLAGSMRGGYIHGDFLFFGKLGLAWLNTDFDFDHHRTKARDNGAVTAAPWQYEDVHQRSGRLSQVGLLLGFGAEVMMDDGWSAKLEFNQIFTNRKEFDSVISSGKFCSNQSGNSCAVLASDASAVTPANYRDMSGDIVRQVAKMGRSIVKVGVNKRF
jgi:hypothetical protein